MRKAQKQQMIDIVKTLYEAHEIIRKYIKSNQIEQIFSLLADCQNTAIHIGQIIEKIEGEDFITVSYLENYCDELYQVSLALKEKDINANNILKRLNKSLVDVENSIKIDIKVKYEVVFMPYKASMWDSLESIWKAANVDENCDAYVFPIPYYDRKSDHSLGQYHYEGLQFPDYVPVVSSYNLEKRRPDVIYIHNPYDEANHVTSIDPKFYSNELKKYTDCLVYVPYFSMIKGSGEYDSICPVYDNMDYIVMQSKDCRTSFDKNISNSKILYLGSPKFDKIISMCNNPPVAPLDWQFKMQGKKVYFYNTSIAGMLYDTKAFLKKMQYVFKCFVGRNDVCLLWRPHPLLESTFESMRPQYLNNYRRLKQFFIDKNLGIYDDTPDMDKTVALSNVYIGDAGSSIISLFGMAGKPIFILNNEIDAALTDKDMIARFFWGFNIFSDSRYQVMFGNKLFYSENKNYKYLCDLSENQWEYGNLAIIINDKIYICPVNTQEIAVVSNGEVSKIKLRQTNDKMLSFLAMLNVDKYLVLIPNKYPHLVRYDTQTGEIKYFSMNVDVFINEVYEQTVWGGIISYNDKLLLPSPVDNKVLVFNIKTGEQKVYNVGSENCKGTINITFDGKDFWLMPFNRYIVRRWNFENGEVKEYDCKIDGLICSNFIEEEHLQCDERPFVFPAFDDEFVYLSAWWANKFVKLNKNTGEVYEYIPPVLVPDTYKNKYYKASGKSTFLNRLNENTYLMFSYFDRALYEISLKQNKAKKIDYKFDIHDLRNNANEKGFDVHSDALQYSCRETFFNSLDNFLDNKIAGKPFDKDEQLKSYGKISVNTDGTCGEKVHKAIIDKISR